MDRCSDGNGPKWGQRPLFSSRLFSQPPKFSFLFLTDLLPATYDLLPLSSRSYFGPYLSLNQAYLSLNQAILSLPKAYLSLNQAILSLPKRYLLSPELELLSPERYLLLSFKRGLRQEARGRRRKKKDFRRKKDKSADFADYADLRKKNYPRKETKSH